MTRNPIVASAAALVCTISLASLPVFADARPETTQAQTQPRDPRSEVPPPESAREQALKIALRSDPSSVANWLELAKLQEQRGASGEAEATLTAAIAATGSRDVRRARATFLFRAGEFDTGMAALEELAAMDPSAPEGHQLVGTYYWEKAQKSHDLTAAQKARYIDAGIAAIDRALALKPDYVEALTYKNILLRMKGNLEPEGGGRRAELYAEADALRNRAMELNKARTAGAAAPTPVPPGVPAPPPPPPPPAPPQNVDDVVPVRVGGNIVPPTKLRHVPPAYPKAAIDERVAGLVVVEALIDTQGNVTSTKVLTSIPLLDNAASEAVAQWKFTPTFKDGVAVPVIMTVTVNFSLK